MNIFVFLKTAFAFALFCLFLIYFGIPSWRKFTDKEIILNTKKIDFEKIPTPTLTILANSKETGLPWKNNPVNRDPHYLKKFCEHGNITYEELIDCVHNNTYSFTDIVETAWIKNGSKDVSLLNQSLWIRNFIIITYRSKEIAQLKLRNDHQSI